MIYRRYSHLIPFKITSFHCGHISLTTIKMRVALCISYLFALISISRCQSTSSEISPLRDLLEEITERLLLLQKELELVFLQFSRTVFGFDVHGSNPFPGWRQIGIPVEAVTLSHL